MVSKNDKLLDWDKDKSIILKGYNGVYAQSLEDFINENIEILLWYIGATHAKNEALIQAGQYLLTNKYEQARHVITDNFPFKKLESTSRSYTDKQKMQQFKKDGFIDRYNGDKLVNLGFLKVL